MFWVYFQVPANTPVPGGTSKDVSQCDTEINFWNPNSPFSVCLEGNWAQKGMYKIVQDKLNTAYDKTRAKKKKKNKNKNKKQKKKKNEDKNKNKQNQKQTNKQTKTEYTH